MIVVRSFDPSYVDLCCWLANWGHQSSYVTVWASAQFPSVECSLPACDREWMVISSGLAFYQIDRPLAGAGSVSPKKNERCSDWQENASSLVFLIGAKHSPLAAKWCEALSSGGKSANS